MDVDLKHIGIVAWVRDRLKMSVKTPASCSAHFLKSSRNAVQASSLACIDPTQCSVDICGGKFGEEGMVQRSLQRERDSGDSGK